MASKILVVDDEPKWLRIVSLYLQNRNYEVATALTGEDALQQIDASPPDVVIADIGMPGMDGYELCNRLRSDARTRTIPFIFFTARDDDENRLAARKIGSDDYLTKPCPLQRVVQSVETVMDRIDRARTLPLDQIGSSGRLEEIDLLDLVQSLELQQQTGALLLSNGERTGTLYFKDGVIVHADIRTPNRAEPLFVLLGWKTGRFLFLPGKLPEEFAITASVANLLFEDLRILEQQARVEEPAKPSAAPSDPHASDPLLDSLFKNLDGMAAKLRAAPSLHGRPETIRLLIAGTAQAKTGDLLQALVHDLSQSRWAALGKDTPWRAAYRTEVGLVRVSAEVLLQMLAIRAEKRFWSWWEQGLTGAQGVLLLVHPPSPSVSEHSQAFMKACAMLAADLPVHVLASEPLQDSGWLEFQGTVPVTVGLPDDRFTRLTALNRLLTQWLALHP